MRTNRDDPQREINQFRIPRLVTNSGLLRAVQDRMISNEKNEEVCGCPESTSGSQVAHLPHDLIFKILLLLPAESLHRLSFVCKAWIKMINSPNFIEAHICQSETLFVFLHLVSKRKLKSFSVETKLGLVDHESIFSTSYSARSYISFIEVQDGKGKVIDTNICGFKKIIATCNGLILGMCEPNRNLILINPVTRKVLSFPLGTIAPHDESYGFVFLSIIRGFKVVHLFRDESGYIGCEIFNTVTRSWQAVDGPRLGLFRNFVHNPVVAIRGLHWLPWTDGCDYVVSMAIDDEKFHTISLPIPSSINDRLVEISGYLGFVTHVAFDKIETWILKGMQDENWVKWHVIPGYGMADLIPVSTLRHGREMALRRDRDSTFYAYDFEIQTMRRIEMEEEALQCPGTLLPHVNSLASWESAGALW